MKFETTAFLGAALLVTGEKVLFGKEKFVSKWRCSSFFSGVSLFEKCYEVGPLLVTNGAITYNPYKWPKISTWGEKNVLIGAPMSLHW